MKRKIIFIAIAVSTFNFNHESSNCFSQGTRLWATYYGGMVDEQCWSVATDATTGDVYMAGQTASTTSIASGGFDNTFGGGTYDSFLVKFSSLGGRLWATYYGGTGEDYGLSVATDA